MQVSVKKVSETSTPGRYLLTLSCGHGKMVGRPVTPTRKMTSCGICQMEAHRLERRIEATAIAMNRDQSNVPWANCSQGHQEEMRRRARHSLGIGR